MPAALSRKQFSERCVEAEQKAERFALLRDAFDGSGGFAALPPSQTVSNSGAIANIPTWATKTYLLKHEGESLVSFQQRLLVGRYVNHVRRGIQSWVGLLVRRTPTRKGDKHPAIQALLKDCDGRGTKWNAMRERCVTQACLFGGQPWSVDRPYDPGARNAAENQGPPRFTMRGPDTFYDWRCDSRGKFLWLKVVEALNEKAGPTEAARDYLRATIWYPQSVGIWEMTSGTSAPPKRSRPEQKNEVGVVPAGVLTFADTVGETLFGWGPGQELADLALQDFQDLSRLTETLEKATFPLFLMPIEDGDEEEIQQLDVGVASALGFPKDSSKEPHWCETGTGSTDTHFKRRDISQAEGLKVMGLEQLLQSTAAPTSGLARQYEFQHLDASLSRVGQRVDLFEREVVRLWLLWNGESPERADAILAEYVVEQPDSYDIRDKDAILAQATTTLMLPGLDPFTQRDTLKIVSDTMCQLSPDDKEKRDEWLQKQLDASLVEEPPPEDEPPPDETDATPEDVIPGSDATAPVVTADEETFDKGTKPTITTQ